MVERPVGSTVMAYVSVAHAVGQSNGRPTGYAFMPAFRWKFTFNVPAHIVDRKQAVGPTVALNKAYPAVELPPLFQRD